MSPHSAPLRPLVVMWATIFGSLMLLAVLLFLGWHDDAWTIAAGTLLLSCVFVCLWAVAQGRRTDRDVRDAVARLVEARKAADRGSKQGTS